MNVFVCGLNSYLGRASASCLQDHNFKVYGIVRDVKLFQQRIDLPVNAVIFPFDIVKDVSSYQTLALPQVDLAIYFTQIPDLEDDIGVEYEILSLRNFIFLCQKKDCNRILYIGRSYERHYLEKIEELFVELKVNYTIVLKDVAIGKATAFDQFMDKMLLHKTIFQYNPNGKIEFKPVLLRDVLKWIKKVDWENNFNQSYVEFGGEKVMNIKDIIQLYIKNRSLPNNYRIVPIRSKMLAKGLNKILYNVDYETYSRYMLELSDRAPIDNSVWQKEVDFKYSPLEEGM